MVIGVGLWMSCPMLDTSVGGWTDLYLLGYSSGFQGGSSRWSPTAISISLFWEWLDWTPSSCASSTITSQKLWNRQWRLSTRCSSSYSHVNSFSNLSVNVGTTLKIRGIFLTAVLLYSHLFVSSFALLNNAFFCYVRSYSRMLYSNP